MATKLVIGGGIAGIYSALLLAKTGSSVVLVEQGKHLGGLLNSHQNAYGDWFDYGTHFIAGTEIDAIDEVMLPKGARETWQKFDNEHGANFFAGQLNSACLFVDTSALPEPIYSRGVRQLLEIIDLPESSANLEQQLQLTFGKTFTDAVFAPALGKLFGVGLNELVPDSHLRFGMKRIQILNALATEELKRVPSFDARISFHRFSQGAAARPQYYPFEGGAGEWVKALLKELDEAGVEQLTSTSAVSAIIDGDQIQQVELSSGRRVDTDELIWTAALPPACKLLQVPLVGGPPRLRYTSLINLVVDRPPLTDDHFFFCYDPAYSPFRVTLYSNLQPQLAQSSGRHRVTLEVLSDGPLDSQGVEQHMLDELVAMGIFDAATELSFGELLPVQQGFPVLSESLVSAKAKLIAELEGKYANLHLVGRNCSNVWFMHEVMRQVHEKFGCADVAQAQ